MAAVLSLLIVGLSLGCLTANEKKRAPANLSLNRTQPGKWKGRLPGPGELSLGRTNSIKGTQRIDPEHYLLTITGLVEKPTTMTFKDILEYPYVERKNVMYCVEGWSWSADWRGIVVRDLLREAVPKEGSKRVIFHAIDGYTSSFPLSEIDGSDRYILAYMANGTFLPRQHGYPLRLVAEGKWGYKWVKWIVKVEVTEDDGHRGYWERRGYSDSADVK